MKTIGVIGGMSWESSAEYYKLINRYTKARLGGHHNARSLIVTVDFAPIEALQRAGDWPALGEQLADAARQLERGGAELVILATNTMHRVCKAIEQAIDVPFLHIADPTGAALRSAGIERVGLLGTRYTRSRRFTPAACASVTGSTRWCPMRPNARTCIASFTTSCATA